jgi:hypothetical protein
LVRRERARCSRPLAAFRRYALCHANRGHTPRLCADNLALGSATGEEHIVQNHLWDLCRLSTTGLAHHDCHRIFSNSALQLSAKRSNREAQTRLFHASILRTMLKCLKVALHPCTFAPLRPSVHRLFNTLLAVAAGTSFGRVSLCAVCLGARLRHTCAITLNQLFP